MINHTRPWLKDGLFCCPWPQELDPLLSSIPKRQRTGLCQLTIKSQSLKGFTQKLHKTKLTENDEVDLIFVFLEVTTIKELHFTAHRDSIVTVLSHSMDMSGR